MIFTSGQGTARWTTRGATLSNGPKGTSTRVLETSTRRNAPGTDAAGHSNVVLRRPLARGADRHRLFLPALLFLLCCSAPCLGHTIKVRVVNEKNGHPVKGAHVHLSLDYGDDKSQSGLPPNIETAFDSRTDKNGEAKFQLPQPPPSYLSVQVQPTTPYSDCTCVVSASSDEVIKDGYARTMRGHAAPDLTPGEILVQVRPLNFFQRLLYPFEKW